VNLLVNTSCTYQVVITEEFYYNTISPFVPFFQPSQVCPLVDQKLLITRTQGPSCHGHVSTFQLSEVSTLLLCICWR